MSLSPEEIKLWVDRFCFFYNTAEDALQVLRDKLDKATFIEIYTREEEEWRAGADMNPCARFPLNDTNQQNAFFLLVEGVCRGFDKVLCGDYNAYVPPVLLPSSMLTTAW